MNIVMSETKSDNDDDSVTDNDYINNITMNFLMNKSQHQKFISTEDPTRYEREQKHIRALKKHKNEIIDLTRRLICEPDTQITTDVNGSFNDYTRTLLRYLKMKEIENKGYDNNSDEETLFGTIDESDEEDNNSKCDPKNDITSFWGTKLIKK
jgi:hypothetical protein